MENGTAHSPVTQQQPTGVHLVGSVPLPTTKDVFLQTTKVLPNRLVRIPDGEPAHRQNFVYFQRGIFSSIPQVVQQYDAQFNVVPAPIPTSSDLSALESTIASIPPLETGYDTLALESYETFKQLRADGHIAPHIKFQVSIPTALNVTCLIAEGYQATMEPHYEAALFRAVKNLEASIPYNDLSIQWDMAAEFAMLEGITWPHFKPFFSPVKEGIIERAVRLADSVDSDSECGFHLCYGDIAHRHFVDPKDMGKLVEMATAIMKGSKRDITFIQMPVPKDRTDDEYFAPLKELELGNTELYLGVVHYNDLEGTKERIAAASKTGKKFGVATECGMGRTPPDHLESILEISAEVTKPYDR
jgi:hypothetical protein